ncbi:hypothetical protein [Shewanella sp. SNU WT4]|uniref:hypothetical protein n=1 Tax=Shewanella sp. SNU WT4 TaxID=2590015 RepID=UPI001F100CA4|nr:hypothetical protein [Shewanella sp. SNU WT4]
MDKYFVVLVAMSLPLTAISAEIEDCEFGAASAAEPVVKIDKIHIQSNDIFDENLDDSFFIHRWANALHINTLPSVIANHLSISAGQTVTAAQINEAERLLRAQPHIREAKVSLVAKGNLATTQGSLGKSATVGGNTPTNTIADNKIGGDNPPCVQQDLLVETWDNWSLLPTFSAGRSSGENKLSFGIKEDNLLGTGISTDIKYQSDQDRTGYKLAVNAPINWIPHSNLLLDFYDNSDGQASHLLFNKPFFSLDGSHSYQVEYLEDVRIDTLEQNGVDINKFQHDTQFYSADYGWLYHYDKHHTQRIIAGVTADQHQFYPNFLYPDGPLPQDRDFLYPWLAWESIEDEFKVLNNVNFINHSEDINLGFYHYLQVGLETRDRRSSAPGYHIKGLTSMGFERDNHLVLAQISAKAVLNTGIEDYYWAQMSGEYYYNINPKWTSFNRLALSTSQHLPLDMPSALGDNTGLRGYANDYQYGDHQWLFTTELRHYPNINLYQFAELGWTAFADIGQAFGGDDSNNAITGPIGSVGVGARLYSSRSSYGNVAHIDISVPITTGPNVSSWEWRFQVKNRF